MNICFKEFLLNENAAYLSQQIGDILDASQELVDQGPSMGARHQVKNAETIANQIRRILHSDWQKQDEKYLKVLQKIGVAIMKAIEEKDDLIGIMGTANQELVNLQSKLGEPIQNLGTPAKKEEAPEEDSKALANPQGEENPESAPQQTQQQPDLQQAPQGQEIMPGAAPGQMPPPAGQVGMSPNPPAFPMS